MFTAVGEQPSDPRVVNSFRIAPTSLHDVVPSAGEYEDYIVVQFNVVIFASATTRVGVVGDLEELGSWQWDRVVPLYPLTSVDSEFCPTWFSACVALPADSLKTEYKFVKWHDNKSPYPMPLAGGNFPLPKPPCPLKNHAMRSSGLSDDGSPSQDPNQWTIDDLRLPLPAADLTTYYLKTPANQGEDVDLTWEGRGFKDNRMFVLQPDKVTVPADKDPKLVHVWDPQNIVDSYGICGLMTDYSKRAMLEDKERSRLRSYSDLARLPHGLSPTSYYALPPGDFADVEPQRSGGLSSEYVHTTRYYYLVKETHSIHFNKIIPRIYCGSCPRQLEHLDMLKNEYNVAAVFNLQAVDDLPGNWIDDAGTPESSRRTPDRLQHIYSQRHVALFHIPTVDMSTPARANMIAQGAWLVGGYLASNPDKSIYIHCNAGVGRAIACTCAFLHCCLRLPLQHTLNFVRRRRPVAYVDRVALQFGRYDFDAKFLGALPYLGLPGLEDSDGFTEESQVDTESTGNKST